MRRFIASYLAVCIVFLAAPFVFGQVLSYTYPRPFDLALLYFSYGRWDLVTPELNKALQENSKDPELLAFIGSFLSALGDQSQARTFFTEAEKAKASPGIYILHGDVYRMLNNSKKAEEYYKKALQRQPESVMAYVGIGKLREKDNKLEEALGFYLQALNLNPERLETLLSAGIIEYELAQFEKASEHFQTAVEIDPAGATTHLWYAKSLYALGDIDKGLQQLERSLELDAMLEEATLLKSQWQGHYSLN